MLVLGITDGITCGAALLRDGRVLAAVNDERLSRLKMAYGFPRLSIAEVLRIARVSPHEIDRVAAATVNNHLFDGLREFEGWMARDKGSLRNSVFGLAGRFGHLIDTVPGLEGAYYRARSPVFASRRRAIRRILDQEFDIRAPVEFVDHHLAHAASAYFTSGMRDATVVTMDGGGDGASSHVYIVRDGEFHRVGYTSAFNSVANYYAYVTDICGFKAQKHEGKITGLAAHGRPVYSDLLDRFVTFEAGKLRNVGKVLFSSAVQALRAALPSNFSNEDLAASIQAHCERLAVTWVQHHLGSGAPQEVALAGGLFANVRINQKVAEIDGVRRLFVHPGMTDQGLSVGSALALCVRNRDGDRMDFPGEVLQHVYLGAEFEEGEIEATLREAGLAYSRPQQLARVVAGLLADGYVVARFDGRMEYGPRALGNRSILYQPNDRSVNDWLNKHLDRTEFMPFAPSTLYEHAGGSYHRWEPAAETARFMTITYDCTDHAKKHCRGVVHLDGTARPQLVRREDNPGYYDVIEEFRRRTSVPTVINTSFNMHEEPIVCTPQDAVRAFLRGHLDYLAIGPFLVKSPAPLQHALRPMEP